MLVHSHPSLYPSPWPYLYPSPSQHLAIYPSRYPSRYTTLFSPPRRGIRGGLQASPTSEGHDTPSSIRELPQGTHRRYTYDAPPPSLLLGSVLLCLTVSPKGVEWLRQSRALDKCTYTGHMQHYFIYVNLYYINYLQQGNFLLSLIF